MIPQEDNPQEDNPQEDHAMCDRRTTLLVDVSPGFR